MKIRYLRAARIEAESAVTFYEGERPGWGRKFRDELDYAIKRIGNDPESYPLFEEDVRFLTFRYFPYAVFFQCLSEAEVLIVAIAHGSRDEGYWRDRLPD
jgi:plasmid stabilization system protein ParE